MDWWAVRHRAAHHLVEDDAGYVFSERRYWIYFLIQGLREEVGLTRWKGLPEVSGIVQADLDTGLVLCASKV